MISYRKLAMRVLGHSPVSAVKTARRSTAKRAAALTLTAALVVGMTLPAFAGTWYIENGDISISAGESGNDVTQNGETTKNDTDTVITNRDTSTASSNTVTIDADEGKTVNVTLDNVNIDTSETGEAAVSVTGSHSQRHTALAGPLKDVQQALGELVGILIVDVAGVGAEAQVGHIHAQQHEAE